MKEYIVEIHRSAGLTSHYIMRWKNELPTQEGWFWVIPEPFSGKAYTPIMVRLQSTDAKYVEFEGTEIPVTYFDAWMGPIPTPEAP
jgi:hypothetical protein